MDGPPRLFEPVLGSSTPRFAGISTFMRLPYVDDPALVDIGIVGIPWDGGTTNRPGARYGPRDVRSMSAMTRRIHHVTGVAPYELCRVADLGDVAVDPINRETSLDRITAFFARMASARTVPLAVGGDHLVSLPLLRGLVSGPPLGMVHFDAHSDTEDTFYGDNKLTHGTPFRRAIEERLIDPRRTIQIGIRGAFYARDDLSFAHESGIRLVMIEELFRSGPDAVITEIGRVIGTGPCYVTFDIDALDPVYAPGTGTPEVGGLTTFQAQHMIRGLMDLDVVAADLVEVSPAYDPTGNTALVAATLLFELLCVLAHAHSRRAR